MSEEEPQLPSSVGEQSEVAETTEELGAAALDETVIPVVDTQDPRPVSEQLAAANSRLETTEKFLRANKDLQDDAPLAETRHSIDSKSLMDSILHPIRRLNDGDWKKVYDNLIDEREGLAAEAAKYMPEIHAEALDYAAAYTGYLEAGSILGSSLNIENTGPLPIDEFMKTLGEDVPGQSQNQGAKLPNDPNERKAYFEKLGRLRAIQDLLTPRLPVETRVHPSERGTMPPSLGPIEQRSPGLPEIWDGYWDTVADSFKREKIQPPTEKKMYNYSVLPGTKYEVTPGQRFPRIEVTKQEAEQTGAAKQAKITIEVFTHNQPAVTEVRYIPLSEQAYDLIESVQKDLHGELELHEWGKTKNMHGTHWIPFLEGKVSYKISSSDTADEKEQNNIVAA